MPALVFILGGLAGMFRGIGAISDFFGRFIIWGGTVGAIVGYLTFNPSYALISVILAGLGVTTGYWGEFNLVDTANRNWKNYAKLTLAAMIRMLYISIVAALIGHYFAFAAVLAGIIFVPAYLLAIKINQSQFTRVGDFLFYGTILTAFYLGF